MDKLIPSFKESLFCDNFADGISDIAELGIDSVLSDGLLKDIPIFSLVLVNVNEKVSQAFMNF